MAQKTLKGLDQIANTFLLHPRQYQTLKDDYDYKNPKSTNLTANWIMQNQKSNTVKNVTILMLLQLTQMSIKHSLNQLICCKIGFGILIYIQKDKIVHNDICFQSLFTQTIYTVYLLYYHPALNNIIALSPKQKKMKFLVSCVTNDPKFLPIIQCQCGDHLLSNSDLICCAHSNPGKQE